MAVVISVVAVLIIGCVNGDDDQQEIQLGLEATIQALNSGTETQEPILAAIVRNEASIQTLWIMDGTVFWDYWPPDSECVTDARIGQPLPPPCRVTGPVP